MLGEFADDLQGRAHVAAEDGLHQRLEERQALFHLVVIQVQRHEIGALQGRVQVGEHVLDEAVAGERIGVLQELEAEVEEALQVPVGGRHLQLVDQGDDRVQVVLAHILDRLADHQTQQHLDQLIEAAHLAFRHFLHHRAAARQDVDQVAPLQDQQRLAHRPAAHFQLAGHAQFLDAVAGQHVTTNDLRGQMAGDLFGKAFPGFKGHVGLRPLANGRRWKSLCPTIKQSGRTTKPAPNAKNPPRA